MKDKIKILIDAGGLTTAPGAILEFHEAILVGGVGARGGEYHISPRVSYKAHPYRTSIIYASSVDELKTKIQKICPESRYILEYI